MSAPATRWEDVYATQTARITELERENAALREQLADIKSVLFAVRADLEPADREPAVLMIGDGILAALLHAARAKEAQL